VAITSGTRLGPYEIISQIGAGGMGEVYKARDTRLDRVVAIKVLPAHLADRTDLRERFEREARTIAGLNHPHICTLHDIGQQDGIAFLVMEYLEGETLATRLLKGPLPVEQVLQYAIEISDALDKAHRNGATHRDIKPGNIMLTKSGSKLLDFGLAKLKQDAAPAVPASQLPTLKENPTVEGTILGTLQYMSPEQLEGKVDTIDGRTDIFAFGAVVYEMATGKKAFEGKSSVSLMGAILKDNPPPISSLQPMTPPALDRVVKKCLAKEPEKRWQAASDVCDELKWIAEGGSQAGVPTPVVARHQPRQWIAWASVAAAVLVAVLVASVAYFRPAPAEVAPVRFTIGPPENGVFPPFQNFPNSFSLSPDGSKLAFVATDSSGRSQLWIRALDSPIAQRLPGTENPTQPFWSADSRFLGFSAERRLKKIAVSGGPAQTVAEGFPTGGGSWSREGVILFAQAQAVGPTLQRVSAAGGATTPVTALDGSQKENGHFWPHFLPDGNHYLYFARSTNAENNAIYVASLDSEERKLLLNANSNPVYVSPGYLLFNRQGTLMAQSFDAGRLELTGEAIPVAEGVTLNAATGRAAFSASENGVLAYRGGEGATQRTLVWVSRNGTEQPLAAPARNYQQPRLSPDGRRLGLQIDEVGSQIWIFDLARETLTRLTFEGNRSEIPLWTPDGQRITFYATPEGPQNLFWQPADGTGKRERLTTANFSHVPGSWSPDGQLLAFNENVNSGGRDIWVLRLSDRKAEPFTQTPFIEGAPQFSPDGRWLAYISDESGRPEIYVQPYPGPGGKWLLSTEGGTEPMWNRNGRELFYRNGDRMMSVEVRTQPTFSAGRPRMLFERQYVTSPFPQTFPHYDVSSDGQRFLMVKQGGQTPAQINIVLNWPEELKSRAPVKQ